MDQESLKRTVNMLTLAKGWRTGNTREEDARLLLQVAGAFPLVNVEQVALEMKLWCEARSIPDYGWTFLMKWIKTANKDALATERITAAKEVKQSEAEFQEFLKQLSLKPTALGDNDANDGTRD